MAAVDAVTLEPVERVASRLGLSADDLSLHGPFRAKIRLDPPPPSVTRRGRYVLVTAITPTQHSAGKTVTTIGLAMGLERLGHSATATLRQSSLGPTFGSKGGGAGGGKARIEPLEEALLGLGSDIFAVEMANNLLASVVDDSVHRGTDLDPSSITWRRVLDVDDRALRQVLVGLGGTLNGPEHQTGFDITAASEVMAILTLSRDVADLRSRLASIVLAWDRDGRPVTAGSLEAAGSMAVLLRDAICPNLMQTTERTPVMIHTGPFGNIAPGNSSVIADGLALPRSDFVVTEAGFGSDLGAEKFFHLKCPISGLSADAAVLVATVPCLRDHGGATGHRPDVAAVAVGSANLRRHVENLRAFGVPTVVAINRFPGDSDDELATVAAAARDAGARAVAEHYAFADGGSGCIELAEAVATAVESGGAQAGPHQLFHRDAPVEEKVEVIARKLYGARGVEWTPEASARLEQFRGAGFGQLPVCMAKTHLSLSHDPKALGAPSGFVLPVTEVRLAAGAGYVTVLTGAISTMPGLPSKAKFREIDLMGDGTVVGLT
ncbi:MAG: formate--tetrahydrofolate ligase [Acidimicrobiales bacterium]